MNQRRRVWMIFLSGIFLMSSSNVWGESWNRAVINNSKYQVTVKAQTMAGNVWFGPPCNNENGPCTIAPNTRVDAKFTTTEGQTYGWMWAKRGGPDGQYMCRGDYLGSSLIWERSVYYQSTTCPWISEVPGWPGYLQFSD